MAGDANNISFYELLDKYQFKFYKYYHVLFKVGLKPNEVHTLSIILSFNKAGQVYNGSYGFLCKELNITSKTALNALNSLIDKGFIKKQASKGGNVSIYSVNEKFLKDIFLNYEKFSQLTDNKPLQNVTVKHEKTSQKQCKNSTVNSGEIPHNKNIYNNNNNIYAHSKNEHDKTKTKIKSKRSKEELEKKFIEFWDKYPKKVSKKNAKKVFLKLNPSNEQLEKIYKALENQKKSKQWQDKQYIPYPATWLNGERWEDETDTTAKQNNITDIHKDEDIKYMPMPESLM